MLAQRERTSNTDLLTQDWLPGDTPYTLPSEDELAIQYENLTYYPGLAKVARKQEATIFLSRTESSVLGVLISHPGIVIPYKILAEALRFRLPIPSRLTYTKKVLLTIGWLRDKFDQPISPNHWRYINELPYKGFRFGAGRGQNSSSY